TIKTPIGRKARPSVQKGGGPLINVSMDDVHAAGVKHMPRVASIENGIPKFENGEVLPSFKSVVWATGFKLDFSWLNFKVSDESGWPDANRGVSNIHKGLYFVGMPFQFGLSSAFVGGVGRDAEYIAKQSMRSFKLKSTGKRDMAAFTAL